MKFKFNDIANAISVVSGVSLAGIIGTPDLSPPAGQASAKAGGGMSLPTPGSPL